MRSRRWYVSVAEAPFYVRRRKKVRELHLLHDNIYGRARSPYFMGGCSKESELQKHLNTQHISTCNRFIYILLYRIVQMYLLDYKFFMKFSIIKKFRTLQQYARFFINKSKSYTIISSTWTLVGFRAKFC